MHTQENMNTLHKTNNERLSLKREWETPELFKLDIDDTLFTANPGTDGVVSVS